MNLTSYLAKGSELQHVARFAVYTRGTKEVNAMEEEKRVLVKLGESNQAVTFLSDGDNDQEVLKEAIRSVYHDEIPETSNLICKSKMKSGVVNLYISAHHKVKLPTGVL